MKKTFDKVLGDFEEYLVSTCKYTKGTSECYAQSYTKPAINKLIRPWFNSVGLGDPFYEYNESTSSSITRTLIISISDCIISNEIEQLTLGNSAKTIKNWRSGLRKFFNFLESENLFFVTNGINNKSLTGELLKLGGSVKYSKNELVDVFWSRLITQDRAYHNMIYPARILNLICNSSTLKNDYKKLITVSIDNTNFWIDNGVHRIKLKDIDSLEINFGIKSGGNVWIVSQNTRYQVYTENPKTMPSSYERIQAIGLDDLSLDHDVPLQNLIDSKIAQATYKSLKRLSDIYSQYVNGGVVTTDYLSVKGIRDFKGYSPKCYVANRTSFDNIFANYLFIDLTELYKSISFTIMLKSYNSSKGKGTP